MDSTTLKAQIRRVWLGPQTALISTDSDDLLAHADRVIIDDIVPRLVDLGEEYLTRLERYTMVADQNLYKVPYRAYGAQIRHLMWRSAVDSSPQELTFISPIKRSWYTQNGQPTGWYFEGDHIAVLGKPTGIIDILYFFSPSELADEDDRRVVSSIGVNQVTLNENPPSTWAVGDLIDIQDPYRSGPLRYWDLVVQSIVGPVVTFTTEIAGATFGRQAVEIGDYVCLRSKCFRPMVPEPLHGALVHGVASRIAQSQTDSEAYQVHESKFRDMLTEQMKSLDKRYEGRVPILNTNSRFRRWGRTGLGRGRRRFF